MTPRVARHSRLPRAAEQQEYQHENRRGNQYNGRARGDVGVKTQVHAQPRPKSAPMAAATAIMAGSRRVSR